MLKTMTLLPHWCVVNPMPAIYDTESATTIEQTAKLYKAVQEMISSYNDFVNEVNPVIEGYFNSVNQNIEEFEERITKICHDYIKTMDMHIAHQDKVINDSVVYIKNNMDRIIYESLLEMKENGSLDDAILNVFNELATNISNNTDNINNIINDIESINNNIESLNTKIDDKPDSTLSISYSEGNKRLIFATLGGDNNE